jgi:outer membrane protein, adhesin transport system
MKTRTLLLFTASMATISLASTGDSNKSIAFTEIAPAIAASNAVLADLPVAPTAPAAMKPTVLEIAVSEAVTTPVAEAQALAVGVPSSLPVEPAGAPLADGTSLAAALVVEAVAPAVTEVAVPAVAESIAGIMPVIEAMSAEEVAPVAVEIAAVATPFLSDMSDQMASSAPAKQVADVILEQAAPAVVVPVSPVDVSTPAAAIPPVAAMQTVEIAAVAVPEMAATVPLSEVGKVKLPDAPAYAFFDDAASAAPAAAMQAGAMDYSGTVTLEQAIAAALETSPEINQAIMNKEAIEFEREQAQGLYMPRVDIEASAGIRRLENPTRRTLGIADDELYPLEAGITAEQTVIDFGRRHGELLRQAARTDGAALRVAERSENTALLVSRQYLDILLQQRIVAAADDNVTFHRNLVGDLGQGVTQGSISIADQQQAQERLQAAVVRKTEAEESLVNAQIALQTLTGLSISGAAMPQSLKAAVSPTLGEAVAEARQNNPKVKEASADVDAAHAMVEKANGDLYPTLGVEARGRVGEDIDGFSGNTNDVQARVVLRWNIFDGGINRAKVQEMVRRSSEARFRLHELGRYAEEDVRRAWNSMSTQRKIEGELETQSRVSDDLLLSYREQFNVGRRSLLDVLDAQNTRYNVQVRLETARFSEQFAEYQVLAATNKLLATMNLATPTGATSDARSRFDYGPPPPAELQRRRYPR